MWMRSCAVCKALLRKLRLSDSIRCQCGWDWQGKVPESDRPNYQVSKEWPK